MKYTINTTKEIEIAKIRVILPIRYEDEDMSYDFPLRKGDVWEATIDIDSGKIENWPGNPAQFEVKVVDGGTYILLAEDGTEISILQDYVPRCISGDFGDYIKLDIADSGTILNWKTNLTFHEFFDSRD